MPAQRLDLDELRDAIRVQLETGPNLRVEEVAGRIYVSKSTMQRALKREGVTFSKMRRQVQVDVAIERLTRGATCASAASYVGLSRDHLCRLVSEHSGLTPRKIVRMRQLAERASGWRRSAPPRANSWLYVEQRRRWRKLEAQMRRLVAEVPKDSPLADWAQGRLKATRRPDYRTAHYRQRALAERHRRDAALVQKLRRAVAAKQTARSTATKRRRHV
jgi:hypothetical protein